MRRIIIAMLLPACAGSFEEARLVGLDPSRRALAASASVPLEERCERLDTQRITWGAIAKGSAVVAGASGVTAIPVSDSEAALVATGSIALAAATLSAASFIVAEGKGAAWARDCSVR